jgi:hypothetical protein
MSMLNCVNIVHCVLAWNWFTCEYGLNYLMFGVWSQVVSSQITLDNFKFSNTRCFMLCNFFLCFYASFFAHGFALLFSIFYFELEFLLFCIWIIFWVWRGFVIKVISIIYDVCVNNDKYRCQFDSTWQLTCDDDDILSSCVHKLSKFKDNG